MTLPPLTREEFLNYIHQPLTNPQGDPRAGSPTKSTMRYRWRDLRDWDIEAEARHYWESLPTADKESNLVTVSGAHWEVVRLQLINIREPFATEPSLRGPFEIAFRTGHNGAIHGASDTHAEIRSDTTGLEGEPPIGNSDLIFVYDNKLTGIIELKTWWKVDETQIEDVRTGRDPLDGIHHGRLAVEQTYGYMVHDEIVYGVILTFNAFVFMKRQNAGILYMSRMIPNNSTNPTIMKILYFFSHLCTLDPLPHPETNHEGIKIHLTRAEKDTSAAPRIPNPSNSLNISRQTLLPSAGEYTITNPRRSPRRHTSQDVTTASSLYLDINSRENGAYLGCKGWRGTLSTGQTVFAKLWDGWKVSRDDCDHEASVYNHLRDLWGTTIPEFLGSGHWGFCHVLLLSYIDCSMIYQVEFNSTISKNVVKAFQDIHARGVYHGDVRVENILVRKDNSIILIDFEMSEMNADEELLKEEMRQVLSLLAGLRKRN